MKYLAMILFYAGVLLILDILIFKIFIWLFDPLYRDDFEFLFDWRFKSGGNLNQISP